MAYSAAAMYGGAAFAGLIEDLIPGGPSFSLVPGLVALGAAALLLAVGPRLPRPALAGLGPLGAALIADALATTAGTGDAAVLYMWPVLWVAYFFGRRGTVLIVAWVGVVHALAVLSLPGDRAYFDRWLDVMVSVGVVAAVVQALSGRNQQLVSRLAAEARIDKLTGLLNRRGFEERERIELARARRERAPVGLIMFDIDHFKRVNDTWGHEVGDWVLAHLGAVLLAQTRGTDVVARVGGEEFVALLPQTDLGGARALAERIRSAFQDGGDRGVPHPTLSAGVTAAVGPSDVQALLHDADAALYAAKRGGRDRTVVFGQPVAVPGQAAAQRSD